MTAKRMPAMAVEGGRYFIGDAKPPSFDFPYWVTFFSPRGEVFSRGAVFPVGAAVFPAGLKFLSMRNMTLPSGFAFPDGLAGLSMRDVVVSPGFAFPAGLTWLHLGDMDLPPDITFPAGLTWLDLSDMDLPPDITFPARLEWLDLSDTNIPVLHTDERGQELRRVRCVDGREIWGAEYRVFYGRAAALAHWGAETYPDQERGAEFVAAINATEEWT